MEIVEIVNADDPKPEPYIDDGIDEHCITEIARINSINKCNVWFEAHETLLDPSQTGDNVTLKNSDSSSKSGV